MKERGRTQIGQTGRQSKGYREVRSEKSSVNTSQGLPSFDPLMRRRIGRSVSTTSGGAPRVMLKVALSSESSRARTFTYPTREGPSADSEGGLDHLCGRFKGKDLVMCGVKLLDTNWWIWSCSRDADQFVWILARGTASIKTRSSVCRRPGRKGLCRTGALMPGAVARFSENDEISAIL
jgi:hypothetical protein